MLADCMAADGSTQEPYLRHILSSSQSPYQARYRAPSPQAYRGDYPQQHSQNHLRQPHTTFNYTNGYSVQHDEYSPQYWPSGGMDSSPESLARHQQAFAQGQQSTYSQNHHAAPRWSQQSQSSPAGRTNMDGSRPGTLHQLHNRSPQYPGSIMPTYSEDNVGQNSPNHLRREKGKKNSNSGGRSSIKLATDMRSLTLLLKQCESGSDAVRGILTRRDPTFWPRLPGLTKLMGRFTKDGDWRKALAIFDCLPLMGLRPDTTITNAAIAACDKGAEWRRAQQLFDSMDQQGLTRDTITYSSAISALSKSKHWSSPIQLFVHMCDSGVQADAVTCCSLINAMDKAGMWQVAELLLLAMDARGGALSALRVLPPPQFSKLTQEEAILVEMLRSRLLVGTTDLPPGTTVPPLVLMGGESGDRGFQRSSSHSDEDSSREIPLENFERFSSGRRSQNFSDSADTIAHALGSTTLSDADCEAPRSGCGAAQVSRSGLSSARSSLRDGVNVIVAHAAHATVSTCIGDGSHSGGVSSRATNMHQSSGTGSTPETQKPPITSLNSPSGAGAQGVPQYTPSTTSDTPGSSTVANSGTATTIYASPSSSPAAAAAAAAGAAAAAPQTPAAQLPQQLLSQQPQALVRAGSSGAAAAAPPPLRRPCCQQAANKVCCNAVLAAYSHGNPVPWQRAFTLIQSMMASEEAPAGSQEDLSPDTVSFNTVLRTLAAVGQISEATMLYREMLARGHKANAATMAAVMSTAVAAGQPEMALGMWESLNGTGLRPSPACASARLEALIQLGRLQEANRFYIALAHGSFSPASISADCTELLMRAHLGAGDPDGAARIFQNLHTLPARPALSAGVLSAAVDALCAGGRWREVADALAEGVKAKCTEADLFTNVVSRLANACNAGVRKGVSLDVHVDCTMQILDLIQASEWLNQIPTDILEGAILIATCGAAPALAARCAVTAAQHTVPMSAPSAAAALRTCLHSAALDELVSGLASVTPQRNSLSAPVATLLIAACSLCAHNPASHTHQRPSQTLLLEHSMLTTTAWRSDAVHGALALLCAVDEPLVATGMLWAAMHRCHELVPKLASHGAHAYDNRSATSAQPVSDPAAATYTHASHAVTEKMWGSGSLDAFRSMHVNPAHAWAAHNNSVARDHISSAGVATGTGWASEFSVDDAAHTVYNSAHGSLGVRASERLLEVFSLCIGTFGHSEPMLSQAAQVDTCMLLMRMVCECAATSSQDCSMLSAFIQEIMQVYQVNNASGDSVAGAQHA